MATATARMSLGAIFATVGTAANAVTSTLNTAVTGVSILDTYVTNLAQRQQAEMSADMVDFKEQIAERKGREMSERQREVLTYCRQSEEHASLFKTNYEKVMAALAQPA